MKKKIIIISTIVSGLISTVASIVYIVTQKFIPGLAPFAIAVAMVGIIYTMKLFYSQGKITKTYWNVVLVFGIIALVSNIVVAVTQIIVFIYK